MSSVTSSLKTIPVLSSNIFAGRAPGRTDGTDTPRAGQRHGTPRPTIGLAPLVATGPRRPRPPIGAALVTPVVLVACRVSETPVEIRGRPSPVAQTAVHQLRDAPGRPSPVGVGVVTDAYGLVQDTRPPVVCPQTGVYDAPPVVRPVPVGRTRPGLAVRPFVLDNAQRTKNIRLVLVVTGQEGRPADTFRRL